jgi:hypothetical protein
MHALLWLRFAKLLAVALLFSGTLGAFMPRAIEDRRRFAYVLAGPAFLATWASGFGLAYLLRTSLFEPWLLSAMALSFFSLQVVLFAVGREGRRGPVSVSLALVTLVASLALMVFRPS